MRRVRLKAKAAVFVVMLAACTSSDEVTAPVPTPRASVPDGLLGAGDETVGLLRSAASRPVPLSSPTSATRTIGPEGSMIRSSSVELGLIDPAEMLGAGVVDGGRVPDPALLAVRTSNPTRLYRRG